MYFVCIGIVVDEFGEQWMWCYQQGQVLVSWYLGEDQVFVQVLEVVEELVEYDDVVV